MDLCANKNISCERCVTRIFLHIFIFIFLSQRYSLKYSSETDLVCKSGLFLHSGRILTGILRCKCIADTKRQSYKQINTTLTGGAIAGYTPPFCFLRYITEKSNQIYFDEESIIFFLLLFIVKLVVLKRRMTA